MRHEAVIPVHPREGSESGFLKINVIGGGPAGLYASILLKRADSSREISVYERNRADDTFGFGVVFSDATMKELRSADPMTYDTIAAAFAHWDDIDVHYGGELIRSGGHGFAGLSRQRLLTILQDRAAEVGIPISFETEVDVENLRDADLVIAADGVNSAIRDRYASSFQYVPDLRPNRFLWLGTTCPLDAFTFYFRENECGLWRVHAYQYEDGKATFIVEAREETLAASGLGVETEDEAVAYFEDLFAEELQGHPLLKNRSFWRQFPTIRNGCWRHENVVLLGDAAHTAHFSIGSGTRIAMLDGIALCDALTEHDDIGTALEVYEDERRPPLESLQRAAQASLQWFEDTERYFKLDPLQFTFSLLTRSLRITHDNLRLRDPEFVQGVDEWFAGKAEAQSGQTILRPAPPPMFTPFKLREMVLPNRVALSPMCQYCADDGTPGDWHLVNLSSRAVGGAGFVMAEMTNVSRDARITLGCTGLYTDEHTVAWKRIVDFVHQNSAAKIGVQLGHAGRKGSTKLMWEGDSQPLPEVQAWDTISASPIPYFPESPVPHEMSRSDMDAALTDYVDAAHRAIEAGFDLLEVHMAHGYLLASFVSPLTNQRADEYGGSLENRMRFPLEVFDAVRDVWPQERPMSVRISAVDWYPGGMDPAASVEVARMLKAHDCDVVDVSAGQTVSDQQPVYGRIFQTPFADRIRHEVGISTMAVGNISSWMDVNTILAAGRADICLLARAHLFDPYWTLHAAHMQGYNLEWPDQYKSVQNYVPRFEFHFGGEVDTPQ
jgi:anthraniloyl-CoA monooxygenase